MRRHTSPPTSETPVTRVDALFSYHLPLHRLLAAFVAHGASKLGCSLARLMPPHLPADFFERVVEHPIQLQVLLSQTRAGLWVRNGFAALKPATLYRSSAFGEVFMLPDLLLMQFGMLQLGMGRFVSRASTLFGLPRFWAVLAGTVPEEQEDASKTPLAEDLLHMLIMVLCDRSLAGAMQPSCNRHVTVM